MTERSATAEPGHAGGRQGTFGLPTATALVIGSVIGTGVFAVPSALAAYGPISLVAMVLGALIGWTLLLSVFTAVVPYLFSAGAQLYWLLVRGRQTRWPHLVRDCAVAALALVFSFWSVALAALQVPALLAPVVLPAGAPAPEALTAGSPA